MFYILMYREVTVIDYQSEKWCNFNDRVVIKQKGQVPLCTTISVYSSG